MEEGTEVHHRATGGDAEAQFEMFVQTSSEDVNSPEALEWLRRAADQDYAPALSNLGISYLNGRFGLTPSAAQAMQLFARGVAKGSALAVWGMGVLVRDGRGVEPDLEKAFGFFQTAAKMGLAFAQRDLALLHFEGRGTPQNKSLALEWMEKATQAGDLDANFELAMWAMEGELGSDRVNEGLERLQFCARADHARAQGALGAYYLAGAHVEANYPLALLWLISAVEKGNATACANLGIALYDTRPVEAISWFDLAEKLGERKCAEINRQLKSQLESQHRSYDFPEYVTKLIREMTSQPLIDFTTGHTLLYKQAEQGDASAFRKLAHLYQFGIGVPPHVKLAIQLLENAARLGDATAQYFYGEICEMPFLRQNLSQAAQMFRAAAQQGHVDSQFMLARLLIERRQSPQEVQEGLEWLRRAVEAGQPQAETLFAKLSLEGRDVPRNRAAALHFFETAAHKGDRIAQHCLATLLREAPDVERDEPRSFEWLMKSVRQNYPPAVRDLEELRRANRIPKIH